MIGCYYWMLDIMVGFYYLMKDSMIRSMEIWWCVSRKIKENICLKKVIFKMYFIFKVLCDVLDFIMKCFDFYEYNFWIINMFVRIYEVINIMKYFDVILMKFKKYNVKICIINDYIFFVFKIYKKCECYFFMIVYVLLFFFYFYELNVVF